MIGLPQIKKAAVKALINHKGKRIQEKVIVIESDDWGSIRTASIESHNRLIKKGYPESESPFNRLDCLESNTDLEALLEVLSSVKGADGHPAHITFNTIMTNPDFDRIRKDGNLVYHFEHFFETLKRYPQHNKVADLYREGIDSKCITPQFHGREHVHVGNWMNALQQKEKGILDAFDERMLLVHNLQLESCKDFNLDAWGMHNAVDEQNIAHSIADGLNIFEQTFGFRSKSAIAACFSMSDYAETVLNEAGVKHLQGAYIQERLLPHGTGIQKVKHFMGEKKSNGQFFTIRNANFEPSLNPNTNWIETVLQDVYWAFFWGKPAIINSHRLNFIGSLEEKNRTQNLKLLKKILHKIVEHWPDVRFVSSDQLSVYYSD